jgi:membrane-bound serine protease (ClpP class)
MKLKNVISRLLVFFAIACCTTLSRAEVLKLVIDGPIHPITDELVGRTIAEAEKTHADAILIELRTPGGLADSTRDIISKIVASKVPVIIYVAPSGSRAASAGFFILESADIAAMAPGTNTGAAHPVLMFGGQPDKTMQEKIENDSAALMRSIVSKRGRNVEVAESAVRQSKSFTDQEALKDNLLDYVATSDQDLFKQIQSKPVKRFNGETVKLDLVGQSEREYTPSVREQILGWLMDPNITFILLAVGALCLWIEFTHPGVIIPGVVGALFIVLSVFALNLLPVRYAAVGLILLGFVLFILEAKLASHGVLGIGGAASMVLGALLLVDAPIPELRVSIITALAVTIPVALITIFLVSLVLKARASKVTTGSQGLIGEIGIARTPLAPEGKIFVRGELWNAVSLVEVPLGERVVVRDVDGLLLKVEPAKSADRDHSVARG